MTSAVALAVRAGSRRRPRLVARWPPSPSPPPLAAVAGARLAARTDTRRLSAAFTVLVLAVAVYTAATRPARPRLTVPPPHTTRDLLP